MAAPKTLLIPGGKSCAYMHIQIKPANKKYTVQNDNIPKIEEITISPVSTHGYSKVMNRV